jgi:Fe-S-cluster containining protein
MEKVAGVDIHFKCTQCGKCCRDSKVPLTVAEAIGWLNRGHPVQLICEASPWPEVLADEDPRAAHFKRRSFAAMSGTLPTRVVVNLVANNAGACPNLLPDMRCGIYEDRPLVCRIYPAEINPSVALNPAKKACPPEAWTKDLPIFQRNGSVLNDVLRQDVRSWRDADAVDVPLKSRLCAALNIMDAALVHEAVLIYSPAADTLLSALASAAQGDDDGPGSDQWRFVSERSETLRELAANGAAGLHVRDAAPLSYQHVGFEREALFGPFIKQAPNPLSAARGDPCSS